MIRSYELDMMGVWGAMGFRGFFIEMNGMGEAITDILLSSACNHL